MKTICYSLILFLVFCPSSWSFSAQEATRLALHPDARDYYQELSRSDQDNIYYVIHTLGTNSIFGLMFQQGRLEQVGDRTGDIHPLRYLLYVLTHQELRYDFRNMNSTAWKRFREDFSRNLAIEKERNNMGAEIVLHFSQQLSLDEGEVLQLIENDAWGRLMNRLHSLD